ncbi:Fanconi anemia core complex-associated protein 100 [Hoplias malabaricus]|uniref:Fanconi anemia core complex-associated protein 100 n=1 Tax=Hoplias malabaricus TaxID=27720 RepID=UPI003462CBC0
MDAVRCSVNCWADFGDLSSGKVLHIDETEVLLTTGSNDLLVFNSQERRVKTILQCESPVTSLALSDDKNRLFALCQNKGTYFTSLFSQQSSTPSLSTQKCDDVLPIISRVPIIIEDGNVQSLILVEDILVTVSLQETFWRFNLYEVPNSSLENTTCHSLTSFPVPAAAETISPNTVGSRTGSTPVLVCVYPSKDSSSKGHTCKQHSLLEPLLFRLLFGVDASLIHSPVILCGLPDGRVLFFPLLLSARGEKKPHIRMLYSLEQPVTFIGTSITGEQGPQCLVVIGHMGRILLVTANQASSNGKEAECSFIEQTVRGPVVCACVDSEHLYYSTSTNLLVLPLTKSASSSPSSSTSSSSFFPAAEGEIKPKRPDLLSESAACLNVCRVIALAKPSVTPTGCVQLLALSLSGRLLQVTVPQESDKNCVSRLTSSQVGQTMKDLLAGIENVWERASSLKIQLQLKNNILKRLNQVMCICHLLPQERDQKSVNSKPPISCYGVAKWNYLLQKEMLVLTCTLENSSDYALEQGWTLCIEVQSPLSLTPEGASRTYSFVLKKLECGHKMKVSLPLECEGEVFLPVKIHYFLVYSLQSLLNTEESRQLSSSEIPVSDILGHRRSITLALNTLTVDWLDCLRIGQPASPGEDAKQNSAWEATQLFLRSRQIYTEEQLIPKTSPYVVKIQISFELLRTRPGFHDSTSAALCVSVLKWLLSRTSETERQKIVENSVVCAYGPDRQPVRMLTKEVILNNINSEGPLSVVEIQVESSSMAAVCGLHHAVLRRVQDLLKDTDVKCVNPVLLKGQHLCKAVQQAESLYKDLQDTRASATFDGVMKTRTSESLFNLYMKLRENPMVIL